MDGRETDYAFSGLWSENRLKVLIVGAGYGGLAAAIACARQGFSVTVLEKSSGLSPHGDAVAFGANAARILHRWGLGAELWDRSAQGGWWLFKDAQGNPLRDEDLRTYPKMYGAPSLHGHRALFLGSLGVHSRFSGANIRLDCEVVEYNDEAQPSLTLRSGEIIHADVIIVCDGISSMAKGLLPIPQPVAKETPCEYGCFRAAMKSGAISKNKICAHLLDGCVRTWIGPDAHAQITPLDRGRQISFSFTHRCRPGETSLDWRDRHSIEDVLSLLEGWDQVLVTAIGQFPLVLNWGLPVIRPAETWLSAGGSIAFLGDAVHSMPPTAFQGASSAIEDAATLAICLALAGGSPRSVPLALKVYEALRRPHVEQLWNMGLKQRHLWHSYTVDTPSSSTNLDLLCKNFYSFDAERHVVAQFEETARRFDPKFQLAPMALNDVLVYTTIQEKKPWTTYPRTFMRPSKPTR